MRWAGAASLPRLKSTAEDEDGSESEHHPANSKRKTMASAKTSPERAHKNKRSATAYQQVLDYGENRVVDPLGGQAHVPTNVKSAAVSHWLDGQSKKCMLTC